MINVAINNVIPASTTPVLSSHDTSVIRDQTKVADTTKTSSVDLAQVKQAAEVIAKTIQSLSRNLELSVDEDSGRAIVKVIDKETNELIRQIPSEEVLAIAKSLDKLQGLLIQQKA